MKTRQYQKHELAMAIGRLIDSIDSIYYRSRFSSEDRFWLFTESLYCRLLNRDIENCNEMLIEEEGL